MSFTKINHRYKCHYRLIAVGCSRKLSKLGIIFGTPHKVPSYDIQRNLTFAKHEAVIISASDIDFGLKGEGCHEGNHVLIQR